MDRRWFEAICSDPAFHAGRVATAGADSSQARPEIVKYVKCPVCLEFMSRKNYANCSGVVIDLCRNHGTWLDASELERIMEFIRTGGPERVPQPEYSRMYEARRQSAAVWEKQAQESRGIFGKDNSIGRDRDFPVLLEVVWFIIEIVCELG